MSQKFAFTLRPRAVYGSLFSRRDASSNPFSGFPGSEIYFAPAVTEALSRDPLIEAFSESWRTTMNPQSTQPYSPSATSDLLTAPEAAIYLRISLGTLRHRVCRRKIPFVRIGRTVRFRKAHLDRLISENLQQRVGA